MQGSAPTPASSKCQHSWALISLVLSQHHDGGEPSSGSREPVSTSSPDVCHHSPNSASFFSDSPEALIGEVYLEKIIEKLHATLSETKSLSDAGNLEPLISFICDVASTFFSSVQDCLLLQSAEELLLTVFQLTAVTQTHSRLSGRSKPRHRLRPSDCKMAPIHFNGVAQHKAAAVPRVATGTDRQCGNQSS